VGFHLSDDSTDEVVLEDLGDEGDNVGHFDGGCGVRELW